jgi:hypothetical protein
MLVDGAVRDLDELAEIGLPIWARFVRAQGATKGEVGQLDVPVVIGGAEIRPEISSCSIATARWRFRRAGRRGAATRARACGARARDARALRGGRALVRPQRAARDRGRLMEVAVLGLGEAGGRIARDLVAAGCTVRGFDPAQRPVGIANATARSTRSRRRRRAQRQRGDRGARDRLTGRRRAASRRALRGPERVRPRSEARARRRAAGRVRRRRARRRRAGLRARDARARIGCGGRAFRRALSAARDAGRRGQHRAR